MNESATGISWYRKRDYPTILSMFLDSDGLPETYEEWLAQAIEIEKQIQRGGGRVIRAYIDPVEFRKWCKDHGHNLDAGGRMAFGSSVAAETVTKEHNASTAKTKSWKMPS